MEKGLLAKVSVLFLVLVLAVFLVSSYLPQLESKSITQVISYSDLQVIKKISFSDLRVEEYSFDLKDPVVVFFAVPKSIASNSSEIISSGDFSSAVIEADPVLIFTSKELSAGRKILRVTLPLGDENKTALAFVFPLREYDKLSLSDKNLLKQTVVDVSSRGEENYEINESQKVMQDYADGLRQNTLSRNPLIKRINFAGVRNLFSAAVNSLKNAVKEYSEKAGQGIASYDVSVGLSSTTINYYSEDDVILTFSPKNDLSEYSVIFTADDGNSWSIRNTINIAAGQKITIPLHLLRYAKPRNIMPGQKIYLSLSKYTTRIEFQPTLKILFDGNITDKIELRITGKEALKPEPWPSVIELGVTSLMPTNTVSTNITYPLELRSSDQLGHSVDVPTVETSAGTLYSNVEVPGVHVSVERGTDGNEPHKIIVQADYGKLILSDFNLPRTVDFNVYLRYLFSPFALKIQIKVNLNKPGVILAPEDLNDAAQYVSQIKGWPQILVGTDKNAVKLPPAVVGRAAKEKILEEYNKGKFVYLQILGDSDKIPIQERSILDNAGDAPVLDSFYFGEMNEDSYPELAVARIPINDSGKIINYFKIEKAIVKPKIAIAIFPDGDKGTLDNMEKQIKTFTDKSKPVPQDLLDRQNSLLNWVKDQGFHTGIVNISGVEKGLAISPYDYEIRSSGQSIEHNDANILFFVNPDSNEFNSIVNENDWVATHSHGSQEGFFDSWNSTCMLLSLDGNNHPFLTGHACNTSSGLGKKLMEEGALMYNGNYFPSGLMPLSLFGLGINQGIGEAFRDGQRTEMDSNFHSYYAILYGDPSITFPVKESLIKTQKGKIIFSRVKPEFLLSKEALSDPSACFSKHQSDIWQCFDLWPSGFPDSMFFSKDDRNLLFAIRLGGVDKIKVAGVYSGFPFELVKSANIDVAGKKIAAEVSRIGNADPKLNITVDFSADIKKFLYDNNAIEKGFAIEFKTT